MTDWLKFMNLEPDTFPDSGPQDNTLRKLNFRALKK